jgi:nitroreductase/FMN reductase [NAD(P)H]
MTDVTIADLIEQRFGLPTQVGSAMPAEGTVAGMLSRRSMRRFTPQPVAPELMEVALAAALSAPAKSDLQQASIIMVREAAQRTAINALVPSMPWIANAPEFLVFCGDNRRMRRIAELRGKPFPNDTLDMFMNAAVDAGIVLQAFITAAEALGLAVCPISLIRNQVERASELLRLPQGVFPVAGLCVGYPNDAGRLSMRLPPAVTVHVDHYDASDFDAELAAYDARRAAREPTAPEKQRNVDKFGTADPYTWSEDKARQYHVPERHSFGPYVRGQGFALK